MATTCLMYMRREIDWLKHSGYPEILGYNGEVIARRIEKINVPEDYIEEARLAEIMEGENETDL